MKKTLVFIFCFIACVVNTQAQEKWDYPVKPGSEEWRIMPYNEKVEKLQPPKELVDGWDTEMLFKYCLDYPLNMVTWMYSNPNAGFKVVYEQSTVWQEFVRRKDAVEILMQYFEMLSFKRLFEIKEAYIRGNEMLTLCFLEKLVSETDFTGYLDASGKRKLANAILQTHLRKKDYPDRIYGYSYNSSLSALIKILESDKAVSANDAISLTKFREKTKNEYFADDDMDAAIITKTLNYINK